MQLITERMNIKEHIAVWVVAHRHSLEGILIEDEFTAVARAGLKALEALDPETCSAADVNGVLGSTCYFTSHCSECNHEVSDVVSLGYDDEYECAAAVICKSCLEKALSLI